MIYVNMTDRFMSYWGMAEGKRSRYCIACHTLEQAEAIKATADDRPEMLRVALASAPARDTPAVYVTVKDFADLSGPWLKYYRPASRNV